jgi:iron(III) transport system substrate-binding protein
MAYQLTTGRGRALITAGALCTMALLITAPANAAEAWKAKWDKVVAAAEKEGSLDVSGPSGRLWTKLLKEFSKDYPKIKVKVTPFSSRTFWPRILKEREVGQYLWDLRIGGADTQVYKLIKKGGIANVRAMMILPEVANEANWHGGFDHMFLDNAKKYVPSFGAYESPLLWYNRAFIKDGEITDIKQLLDPKWKGKFAMANPRGGSTAVSMALVHKVLGARFITELFEKQKPTIIKNRRQLIDWVLSGQYPLVMGLPNSSIVRYRKKGIKVDLGKVRGINTWSVGVAGIQVLKPRPHPNATKVFVNWIMTKKVQAKIMPTVRLNSRRKDVPIGDPGRALDWKNYKSYISGQTESFTASMLDAKKLIRKLAK